MKARVWACPLMIMGAMPSDLAVAMSACRAASVVGTLAPILVSRALS